MNLKFQLPGRKFNQENSKIKIKNTILQKEQFN